MGIVIEKPIGVGGISSNITVDRNRYKKSFGNNLQTDTFERTGINRYTTESAIINMVKANPKKINAINEMKDELNLENVFPICERAEKLSQKFDLITSRAVAPLKVISGYALPLLKKDGYFVAFKSVKAQEEIDDAKSILKKFNTKVIDIIEYDLPLEENHTRNLIVIKQQQ